MSTAGQGFKPPVSNTGVPVSQSKPQVEIGLDWLTGSFPGNRLNDVRVLVEQFMHCKFNPEFYPQGWYRRCYGSPSGAVLCSHPTAPGQTHAGLSLPGGFLASLSSAACHSLVVQLSLLGFRASRIDIRFDDFTKTFTPQDVRNAHSFRNYTGFTSGVYWDWHESGEGLSKKIGQTFYMGRRGDNGCGKHLRAYDKSVQSKGRIDSNRFEFEFSQNYSRRLFELLSTLDLSCWIEGIVCFVTGAVDFVDRQSTRGIRKDVKNCPRLDWWEFLVGDVPRIRLSKPRKQKAIKNAITWIEKQVLPTLAMVLNYFARKHGSDMETIFWEAYMRGDNRMSEVHKNVLASSLREICSSSWEPHAGG
jgi:hypothetical protein